MMMIMILMMVIMVMMVMMMVIMIMTMMVMMMMKNGAQWLSGRVLDSRPGGPHRHHCVMFLSKTHLSLLSTGSTQGDLS